MRSGLRAFLSFDPRGTSEARAGSRRSARGSTRGRHARRAQAARARRAHVSATSRARERRRGRVTPAELVEYYRSVSAAVDSDARFEALVRRGRRLPPDARGARRRRNGGAKFAARARDARGRAPDGRAASRAPRAAGPARSRRSGARAAPVEVEVLARTRRRTRTRARARRLSRAQLDARAHRHARASARGHEGAAYDSGATSRAGGDAVVRARRALVRPRRVLFALARVGAAADERAAGTWAGSQAQLQGPRAVLTPSGALLPVVELEDLPRRRAEPVPQHDELVDEVGAPHAAPRPAARRERARSSSVRMRPPPAAPSRRTRHTSSYSSRIGKSGKPPSSRSRFAPIASAWSPNGSSYHRERRSTVASITPRALATP